MKPYVVALPSLVGKRRIRLFLVLAASCNGALSLLPTVANDGGWVRFDVIDGYAFDDECSPRPEERSRVASMLGESGCRLALSGPAHRIYRRFATVDAAEPPATNGTSVPARGNLRTGLFFQANQDHSSGLPAGGGKDSVLAPVSGGRLSRGEGR